MEIASRNCFRKITHYVCLRGFQSRIVLAVSFSCIVNRITWRYSSSRSQMFLKVGVLKNFANFTGKQLRWYFFLIKLKALSPATLLKDCDTGVFLWNLWSFKEYIFQQYTSGGCFLRQAAVKVCSKTFSDISSTNKSLITCYIHKDKLIWKCIHLSEICSHRAFF